MIFNKWHKSDEYYFVIQLSVRGVTEISFKIVNAIYVRSIKFLHVTVFSVCVYK